MHWVPNIIVCNPFHSLSIIVECSRSIKCYFPLMLDQSWNLCVIVTICGGKAREKRKKKGGGQITSSTHRNWLEWQVWNPEFLSPAELGISSGSPFSIKIDLSSKQLLSSLQLQAFCFISNRPKKRRLVSHSTTVLENDFKIKQDLSFLIHFKKP